VKTIVVKKHTKEDKDRSVKHEERYVEGLNTQKKIPMKQREKQRMKGKQKRKAHERTPSTKFQKDDGDAVSRRVA